MSNRIIFFGTPEFAIPALEALMTHGHIPLAIVTAPDRPAGRGLKITSSAISQYSQRVLFNGILLKPERIDEVFIEEILALKPTLGIVVAYGLILPKKLIDAFPQGILNIHPSLLPRHRGPSPMQSEILDGDVMCGVSVMQIDAKMDHGPIRAQESFVVNPNTITYTDLHDISAEMGAQLLVSVIDAMTQGTSTATAQNDADATYTHLLKKDDGLIDWHESVSSVDRKVRALNPWPGMFSFLGSQRVKILKASLASDAEMDSGSGYLYGKNGNLFINAHDGALLIERIQMEGEIAISGAQFVALHSSLMPATLEQAPRPS